uniref:L antigen family member 3 n=1 Tax=Plectus sambesii TaxID=2011161 RepID=A0A914VQ35_9BILA
MKRSAMEDSSDSEPDSGEQIIDIQPETSFSSISLRVPFETANHAEIVYNALRIDKEPKRSKASRKFAVEGSTLIVEITCPDTKFLRKSLDNLFNMIDLCKSTITRLSPAAIADTNSTSNGIKAKRPKASKS